MKPGTHSCVRLSIIAKLFHILTCLESPNHVIIRSLINKLTIWWVHQTYTLWVLSEPRPGDMGIVYPCLRASKIFFSGFWRKVRYTMLQSFPFISLKISLLVSNGITKVIFKKKCKRWNILGAVIFTYLHMLWLYQIKKAELPSD